MYWTVHLKTGLQRVNHSAVNVGDKIYSFGGFCSHNNYSDKKPMDVHILNTENLKWHMFYPPEAFHTDAPYQRYGHSAVAYGTKVYVWGGRNDDNACNQLYCFDTEKIQWSKITTHGVRPGARDGHSACVINNHMYIFGGFVELEDQYSEEVYKLNLNTFVWSEVITEGYPPSPRDFHTATAIDDRMFVFGGRGKENFPYRYGKEIYCNQVFFLDIKTNCWFLIGHTGDIPIGRRSHSAFVYDGEIYIFGGYNSELDTHFNDLHRFNPYTYIWQTVKTRGLKPCERRRQSCVVYGTRMFLFGGTSPVPQSYVNGIMVEDHASDIRPLEDHNDLYILDFAPSLKTLCLVAIRTHQLDVSCLPVSLQCEFKVMTTSNRTVHRIPSSG